MSTSVNKVTLIGRLGSDPEFFTYKDGKEATRFNVATDRWTNRETGEKVTDWHSVKFFDRQIDRVKRFLRKGTLVYVEGNLFNDAYTDKEGVEHKGRYYINGGTFEPLEFKDLPDESPEKEQPKSTYKKPALPPTPKRETPNRYR